ncbi:TetR/AcrR family transcriptional regulator [Kribbella sandramycini]|uniref:AcrR family transcriptional regulator n=1 Tax=Kribbella sandramycini TaxID=60450 RepID=A0A7Y4KYQ1_9ACTN|nr:TetR/AcrR family transcriptional regulator [Kribbella sandramycini]MBB6569796.1 AcrR family transcriptional regulator [Kribbella sandramycini]NOL40377.1 TetR/AcrR family transcriptional regulator [Kribbella sandramycini]
MARAAGDPERSYGGVPLTRRRAERRDRLLAAGVELFTSVGYQQTKITELCAAAGMSNRGFYQEFDTKEQLLLALHSRTNQLAYDHVSQALTALDVVDVQARVGLLVDVFMAAVMSDPRLPRLNYVEAVGVSPALERQHEEWVGRWSALIEQEADQAAASGTAPRRDFHLTAIALVGAITGLLREWQAHAAHYPPAEIAAEAKAVILAAITR